MALVVLHRGVNVGGHRIFRPTTVAIAGHPPRPGVVTFVSVLTGPLRLAPRLPVRFPARGPWLSRNWKTMTAVARVLNEGRRRSGRG